MNEIFYAGLADECARGTSEPEEGWVPPFDSPFPTRSVIIIII